MAYTLTSQEKEVMRLAYRGFTNKEIASRLNVALKQIRTITERVGRKTGRPNPMAAAVKAHRDGQL